MAITFFVVALLSIGACARQKESAYKRIYPPVNISIDQESCSPDPALNKTCPLYIALIMSFGGSYTSSGVIPAMEVALDQINSDPDMLPGYTLHYTLKDSRCQRTKSLDALHTQLIQPPTKIAVVGAGCSLATEPTAEVSHYYNVTQLSCVSTSPELTNRKRFPRHFQLSTDEIRLAYGFFGAIQTFKWRKVSIIVQNDRLFTLTMSELTRLLTANGVSFTETRFETDTGLITNPFLTEPDSRIFVLSMYARHAREVLCRAYNVSSEFHYPRNLFLVNGWYVGRWWEGNKEEQADLLKRYNCTAAQRESLLPSTLATATTGRTVQNYSTVADNGYTGDDIRSAYEDRLNDPDRTLNVTELFLYQICYDGIWTVARALNETLNDLNSNIDLQERLRSYRDEATTGDFGLQHFKYDNDVLLENIFTHLSEISFNGIVGNISFDNDGARRIDTVELLQYRYVNGSVLKVVPVATVRQISDLEYNLDYTIENGTLWSDGVPYDGVPIEKIVSLHVSLTVIFSILATSGIIFAVVCVVLNTHFRDKKLIRLTSPKLNNLIGVGAVILYFNMYTFIVPTADQTAISVLCNINPWLTAIGYSLCYGTIVAKMCRVYYIFNNPKLKKKAVKDWMLALFVLLLLIIDILILLLYTIIEGARNNLASKKVPHRENLEDISGVRQEIIRYFVYVCISRERYITLGILYGYKTFLQIIALVLALSIRKVSIKGLNDAVYIITAIYVSSIVTTVIIVSTYTLVELIHVYASVFCLCLFIGTTMILILVFIPPLIGVYHDPTGSSVFKVDNKTADADHELRAKYSESSIPESDTYASLKKRVNVLENELQKYKKNSVSESTMDQASAREVVKTSD